MARVAVHLGGCVILGSFNGLLVPWPYYVPTAIIAGFVWGWLISRTFDGEHIV